jgi:hypothetical protein
VKYDHIKWRDFKQKHAKSWFHLQKEYQNFVDDFINAYLSNNYPFIAIHLRRGDKIVNREMNEISFSSYIEKLEKITSEYNFVSVFVFSDDNDAPNIFKKQLLTKKKFNVITMLDAYEKIKPNFTSTIEMENIFKNYKKLTDEVKVKKEGFHIWY